MSVIGVAGAMLTAATTSTAIIVSALIFVIGRIEYHEQSTGYSTRYLIKLADWLSYTVFIGISASVVLIITLIVDLELKFTIQDMTLAHTLVVGGGVMIACQLVVLGTAIYYVDYTT